MGCDIHIFAETKLRDYWTYTDKFWENTYYNKDSRPCAWNTQLTDEPYDGRNYDLFALLANVRNGRGFAGCDTGDTIIPIAKPKGLPSDVSEEIQEKSDRWDTDGHSHSYLTLSELTNAQVQRIKISRGWVTSGEYIKFKECGKPSEWWGGVGGVSTKHLPNPGMDSRIMAGKLVGHEYTQVEFELDISNLLDELVGNLEELLRFVDNDAERIRTVFWFDN